MSVFQSTVAGRLLALALVSGVAAACGEIQPFVHNPAEFDRKNADFGKPLADSGKVTICHSTLYSDEEEVLALAAETCGAFGKTAVYRGLTLEACPLITPTGSIFNCLAEAPASGGTGGSTGPAARPSPAGSQTGPLPAAGEAETSSEPALPRGAAPPLFLYGRTPQ